MLLPAALLLMTGWPLLVSCHGSDPLGIRVRGSEGDGAVPLGRAATYAVLAGTRIDNSGSTVVTGDLGVSPGRIVTGFPTVRGSLDLDALKAAVAQTDLAAALTEAGGRSGAAGVSGDLGGQTLGPGLYHSDSTLSISGTLTLDGGGNADAVFVFQGSALSTAPGSQIVLVGGASAANVTWVVDGSATLGAGSTFDGNILAYDSITLGSGATVLGRALANRGAVTMDSVLISNR